VVAKGYETLYSRVEPAKGAKRSSTRLVLVPEAL
jgi:hypothetical protein